MESRYGNESKMGNMQHTILRSELTGADKAYKDRRALVLSLSPVHSLTLGEVWSCCESSQRTGDV